MQSSILRYPSKRTRPPSVGRGEVPIATTQRASEDVMACGVLAATSTGVASLVVAALRPDAAFHPVTVIEEGKEAVGFLTATAGFTMIRRPHFILWEVAPQREFTLIKEFRENPATKNIPLIMVLPEAEDCPQNNGLLYLKMEKDISVFQKSLVTLAKSLVLIPNRKTGFGASR